MADWKTRAEKVSSNAMPQTLVELTGTGRLLVERHRGIRSYGDLEILVGTTYGTLRIQGEKLRLCCMSREQLFISGTIQMVNLERSI